MTLIDGGYHSVDSSEMAFRQAGRLAMDEGLRKCGSQLLEPIERLTIHVPNNCTSGVTSMLSAQARPGAGLRPARRLARLGHRSRPTCPGPSAAR